MNKQKIFFEARKEEQERVKNEQEFGLYALVKATQGDMKKIVILNDLIETMGSKEILNQEKYENLLEEYYDTIADCFGQEFLEAFFNICNSVNYSEYLI